MHGPGFINIVRKDMKIPLYDPNKQFRVPSLFLFVQISSFRRFEFYRCKDEARTIFQADTGRAYTSSTSKYQVNLDFFGSFW